MNGGEDWHRLVLFMPVGMPAEIQAAAAIIDWIQEHCDGYTVSRTTDPVLLGFYRSSDNKSWETDFISILVLDDKSSDENIELFIELVRRKVHREYHLRGRPQQVVLITRHTLASSTYDRY
jgi:hypothetical protein